jgi:hypothetical protein
MDIRLIIAALGDADPRVPQTRVWSNVYRPVLVIMEAEAQLGQNNKFYNHGFFRNRAVSTSKGAERLEQQELGPMQQQACFGKVSLSKSRGSKLGWEPK